MACDKWVNLGFKILDASAFYAGVPFKSQDECFTTSLVYDEIRHIKKNHNALETLIEANRLKIRDPEKEHEKFVINAAKRSGDFLKLSKQDLSVIALCYGLNGDLISDDFAVLNLARNLGINVFPIMTEGIKDVGRWVHYCSGCRKNFENQTECPLCGNSLKMKLLKN